MNYLADLNGTVLGRFAQRLQSVHCLKTSGVAGGSGAWQTLHILSAYIMLYILYLIILLYLLYMQ